MRLPDEGRYTFKVILIESRVTGVLAGLPDDGNETRQDGLIGRREALSSGDDYSHDTYEHRGHQEHAHESDAGNSHFMR